MPILVTLTGASGCGKSTIAKTLYTKYPDRFGEAVSTTTRSMRQGEAEGVAYFFVTREEFERRWNLGLFLERVDYNGNLYGIETEAIKRVEAQGKTTILIVEPRGAQQIRERFRGPLLQLFIKAPSDDHRRQWMAARGDGAASIIERIAVDSQLFKEDGFPWDRVIINHTLDQVCTDVLTAIREKESTLCPARKSSSVSSPPLSSCSCLLAPFLPATPD